MSKYEYKYDNFNKALKRLNEANVLYKKNKDNSAYQDSLIKRYEFTFELGWKTLHDFLIEQGYKIEIASPKKVFAFAYGEGFISDEKIWLEMLEARNDTSHNYGQELSEKVAEIISERFCKQLTNLGKFLADNLK